MREQIVTNKELREFWGGTRRQACIFLKAHMKPCAWADTVFWKAVTLEKNLVTKLCS